MNHNFRYVKYINMNECENQTKSALGVGFMVLQHLQSLISNYFYYIKMNILDMTWMFKLILI